MKKFYLFSLLSMLLAVGFSGCTLATDENDLTTKIPGDFGFYLKVDGAKLFDATNIKIDGDNVVLPPYLEKDIKPEEIRMLGIVNKNIALENVIAGANIGKKNDFLAVAAVTDYDGLVEMLKEKDFKSVSDADGLEIYSAGDVFGAILKKKVFYFFSAEDGVAYMTDVMARVKDNPLSKQEVMAQAVSGKDAVDMAVNYEAYLAGMGTSLEAYGASPDAVKGKMFKMAINFDGNKMMADGSMANLDGKPVEGISEPDPINMATLAYVPEDFNFIIASGKPNPTDPGQLSKSIANAAPQVRPYLQMLAPYIESIDGTTLMAMKLQMPELFNGYSPEYFDGLVMIHMPMDKITEATSNLVAAASMYGMRPAVTGEGMYTIDLGGIVVRFGATDGYFVLSTVPVSATHNSELTKYFVNRKSAGVFDGACLAGMLGFSPLAVMQTENGTQINGEITLEGTTEKFIPALMQALMK